MNRRKLVSKPVRAVRNLHRKTVTQRVRFSCKKWRTPLPFNARLPFNTRLPILGCGHVVRCVAQLLMTLPCSCRTPSCAARPCVLHSSLRTVLPVAHRTARCALYYSLRAVPLVARRIVAHDSRVLLSFGKSRRSRFLGCGNTLMFGPRDESPENIFANSVRVVRNLRRKKPPSGSGFPAQDGQHRSRLIRGSGSVPGSRFLVAETP
jgi:hypothetical protein